MMTSKYFFLKSITEPQTGFRIAFNMFDTDGNEKVDKTEFLVVRKTIFLVSIIIFFYQIAYPYSYIINYIVHDHQKDWDCNFFTSDYMI